MHKLIQAALKVSAAFITLGLATIPAQSQSANVSWGPWQFQWEVANDSGIGIRNLTFESRKVLHKGSLPVIRVKYDVVNGNTCGPYADRINWNNLVTNNNCNNGQKVCQRTFNFNGKEWLEISGRAFIGSYDIVQAWYFTRDGQVQPRLFSRGLQCQINHVHHAYWTLDFDMDGAANDEMFLHSPAISNTGYGPGWFRYGSEFDSRRDIREPPTWFARDAQTLFGVFIRPSSSDGQADSFSKINAGIRRYHGGENDAWAFGANGELGYNNAESVLSQDNVLWYVGHLFHAKSEGPNQYHAVGPILDVRR
jgi:hypothetical protein